MTDKPEPRYAQRDLPNLEPFYCAHISAMTSEGLHSKSDIAAELAFRDQTIEAAEATLEDEETAHQETLALLRSREDLLRRCLEAITWCSGADDFQTGGKAFLGWHALCRPLIEKLRQALGEAP